MPQKRIGQYIRELSFNQKLVFFGSIFCSVSVFMPWYRDTDRFGTGYQFFGITGPLYLVGVLFLVLGATCLASLFNTRIREKITDFGIKISHFHILSASFLVFLFVLTNSVYFHEKFGVNITSKEFEFGMIFAFLGAIGLLAGGILENKSRRRSGILDEDLFEEPRDSSDVKPLIEYPQRQHQDIQQHVSSEEENKTEKQEQGRIEL